ncbi:unnamed protein product [Candidula unifasciata]|uniref:Uncharacterized protein n=1 Tax=Candidula unifasciata TaxID=100452 RepID=A0A8S3YXR3_9EUPU|nr:unnamed protein product [Candidula unifasciata]
MAKITTTKLYVGNLPSDADKDELEEEFRKFGSVVEFDILKDYGFVHFENEAEAKEAVEALDGTMHHGNKIKVEMSRSKVRQNPGMGGKGECYRCGRVGHWSKECPRGPSRDRGRARGDRYSLYDRDPYYPDPYDFYARARLLPPLPYDRYRFDPYERRLPPLPPPYDSSYHDFGRVSPDYYRSAAARDPYYDYYERRRLAALDAYGDKLAVSSSASSGAVSDMKALSRTSLQGRVPGPY